MAGLFGAAVILIAGSAKGDLVFPSPMDLSTPGVVGTIDGQAGDTGPQEAGKAQHLLDIVGLGVTQTWLGDSHVYKTSTAFDYSGTLIGSGTQGSTGDRTVNAGWQYALAKYDGQNAGYVLFYLGGQAATLPQYPNVFWSTDQYKISHYTVFDATPVPEPTTVIAGALLLLPFGVSTLRALRKNKA